MVSLSIKRVVSIFVIRPTQHKNAYHEVAIFRRCATMPTFPNHWAAISGSIEDDDINPLEAAVRELKEETNINDALSCSLRSCIKQGLHVDVSSSKSKGAFDGRIIRVYPFTLTLPSNRNDDDSSLMSDIEMKGTEHDKMQFISVHKFMELSDSDLVPSLKVAFHHATRGMYLELPDVIRKWEEDRINGASLLARQAVEIATNTYTAKHDDDINHRLPTNAQSIAMLRPSMVPIVNVMYEFTRRVQLNKEGSGKVGRDILYSLDEEVKRCVELGVETVLKYYEQWKLDSSSAIDTGYYTVATFSRSSTLKGILCRVIQKQPGINVLCSQSTPGNEGELMAADIPDASWIPDNALIQRIKEGNINLVIIGADCILQNGQFVNKVGTLSLATCCKQSKVPIICCADRWKCWEDDYPPALEDIFELIPSSDIIDSVLIPGVLISCDDE